MPSLASLPSPRVHGPLHERTPGFTLIEVILSLGVIAIAVISVLGLIAPTLSEVQHTQELNEGIACIAKMNSLIDTAPFWNSAGGANGETVWQWIEDSEDTSPTVFIFYNEIPPAANGATINTPVQRVVRFNIAATADTLNTPMAALVINTDLHGYNQFPLYVTMTQFLADINSSSISGPVIAMTLSLSPLAQHFPTNAGVAGGPYSGINEQNFYVAPAEGVLNGLFSSTNFGTFATDPDGLKSGAPFPEAYLPIYIQAFSLSVANLPSTAGVPEVETQIIDTFSTGNRLFTYTTAKLR